MTCEELLTFPLAERIRYLRVQAGSHDKLAAKLETSRQVIIGWEKGENRPGPRFRQALADLAGCPPKTFEVQETDPEEWRTVQDRLRSLEAKAAQAEKEREDLVELVHELAERAGVDASRLPTRAQNGDGH